MHEPGDVERRAIVEDVSRAGLVTQGLLIAAAGSAAGWFAVPGGWRLIAVGVSVALGGVLGIFGRTSAFWIEGGFACWGTGGRVARVPVDRRADIRTVFVPYGPRALHLGFGSDVIEIPIEARTAELRGEIGRVFREHEPNAVLSDAGAMDALCLRDAD